MLITKKNSFLYFPKLSSISIEANLKFWAKPKCASFDNFYYFQFDRYGKKKVQVFWQK